MVGLGWGVAGASARNQGFCRVNDGHEPPRDGGTMGLGPLPVPALLTPDTSAAETLGPASYRLWH